MADLDYRGTMRAWLLDVLKQTGLKATPLAKAAGLAPSTLLRALDADSPAELDPRSIMKIVDKFGVAPPALLSGGPQDVPAARRGFGEPELQAYVAKDQEGPPLFAGTPLTPTQGVWTVRTRALDLAGYLPGDLLLADSAAQPRARDVVVAQIVDLRAGTAETVLRIYDPPYIVCETTDPELRQKPLAVDWDRVTIWGRVVKNLRNVNE